MLDGMGIPISTKAPIIVGAQKDELIKNLRIHAAKFYQDAKLDQDKILS